MLGKPLSDLDLALPRTQPPFLSQQIVLLSIGGQSAIHCLLQPVGDHHYLEYQNHALLSWN